MTPLHAHEHSVAASFAQLLALCSLWQVHSAMAMGPMAPVGLPAGGALDCSRVRWLLLVTRAGCQVRRVVLEAAAASGRVVVTWQQRWRVGRGGDVIDKRWQAPAMAGPCQLFSRTWRHLAVIAVLAAWRAACGYLTSSCCLLCGKRIKLLMLQRSLFVRG